MYSPTSSETESQNWCKENIGVIRKTGVYTVRVRGRTGKLVRHQDVILCVRRGGLIVLIGCFFRQEEVSCVLCRGVPRFRLELLDLSIGMLRARKIKECLIRFNSEKFTSLPKLVLFYQSTRESSMYLRWGHLGRGGAAWRTAQAWDGAGEHGSRGTCQNKLLC